MRTASESANQQPGASYLLTVHGNVVERKDHEKCITQLVGNFAHRDLPRKQAGLTVLEQPREAFAEFANLAVRRRHSLPMVRAWTQ